MAIAGAIPNVLGIWVGIDLFRKGRVAVQKFLYVKNVAKGDLTELFKKAAAVPVPKRSLFKKGCYFLTTAILIIKICRQNKLFHQTCLKLKQDWRSDSPQGRWPKVKLLGKDILKCAVEAFATLKAMYDLWSFCTGTDEERDQMAYGVIGGYSWQILTNLRQVRIDMQAIQEGFTILKDVSKRMSSTLFFNHFNVDADERIRILSEYGLEVTFGDRMAVICSKAFAFLEEFFSGRLNKPLELTYEPKKPAAKLILLDENGTEIDEKDLRPLPYPKRCPEWYQPSSFSELEKQYYDLHPERKPQPKAPVKGEFFKEFFNPEPNPERNAFLEKKQKEEEARKVQNEAEIDKWYQEEKSWKCSEEQRVKSLRDSSYKRRMDALRKEFDLQNPPPVIEPSIVRRERPFDKFFGRTPEIAAIIQRNKQFAKFVEERTAEEHARREEAKA